MPESNNHENSGRYKKPAQIRAGRTGGSKFGEGGSAAAGRTQNASGGKKQGLMLRRIALETLLDHDRSDAYVSIALDRRLRNSKLSDRDRAFVTQLVYGTVEDKIRLDWQIDQFLAEEKTLDPIVRCVLRMGCYQLYRLDRVPDMAAVDESVSLTRAMGLEAYTGLVNAVLRRMIREKDRIVWPNPETEPIHYLSVTYSAPEALCGLLADAWGIHDAMEILRYKPQKNRTVIRVNTERCTADRLERLLSEEGLHWTRSIVPGAYRVEDAGDLTRLRGFTNGLFTIQGESSILAARAVEAKPGQTILDACAAPGGKSAVIAEEMLNSGRVYAWDKHPHRVELIKETMNRLHLENVRPMVRDASVPRPEMNLTLDAALVDAPCSGTGVMFEKPDLKYRVTREGTEELCRIQTEILDVVAPAVKVGGNLVYSTCSVLPQENEEQIRSFLDRHPEYRPDELESVLPAQLRVKKGAVGVQILPHADDMEGFYICRLKRVSAGE